jgi:hypothetical protein
LVDGIILILVALLLTLWMIFIDSKDVGKSGYTQAHGVADVATVSSVHSWRGSVSVTVTLARPVNGTTTTTVSTLNSVSFSRGARISVLVDPKDPGYAELPGSRSADGGDYVLHGVIGGIFLILGAARVAVYVRNRRRASAALAGHAQD